MDDACSIKELAALLHGEAHTEIDPLAEPTNKMEHWGEYLHEQEGGMISIAGKLGKAAGIKTEDLPYQVKGLLKVHNPLMEMIKGGENPNVLQRGLFDFLAPSKSVAKPILAEYVQARADFKQYIKDAPDAGMDVYKEEVASRATELLKKVEENPSKYGVDSSNYHMTTRFLKQVENGWPYEDYAGKPAKNTADLRDGITGIAEAGIGNAAKAHVILNPMIYLFHVGMTPIRLFAEYPVAALKIIPDLLKNSGVLLGQALPEAERAGVYTKALSTINPLKMEKGEFSKSLTGIPQTQTFNESLAYLLSKHGIPLDQALERIALSGREPLDQPMFMTAPDRGGSVGALTYMRYVMFQHAAYLNMVKRVVTAKDPQMFTKAVGSLTLYTALNYALYGQDAAIPGSGIISKFSHVGGDGSEETESDKNWNPAKGNLVKHVTGLDLGEGMSPLSYFDLYHTIKMLDSAGRGVVHDAKNLSSEATATSKAFSVAHALLTATEFTNIGGWTTPHSLSNAVKSYGEAVDSAADNPMGGVDYNEFFNNEIKSHLGQRVANDREQWREEQK